MYHVVYIHQNIQLFCCDSICCESDSANSILCSEYDAINCMTTNNVTIESNSYYNYGLLGKTSTQGVYRKLSITVYILS